MKNITSAMFDGELINLLSEIKASQLITIPGIYEIVSEEFNNEVIDRINNENEETVEKFISLLHVSDVIFIIKAINYYNRMKKEKSCDYIITLEQKLKGNS